MLASCPSDLLPQTGYGSRIAVDHHCLEAPNIHPQLQSIGADNAQHLTFSQVPFDLPALLGKIAAAVAPDLFRKIPQPLE